MVDILQGLAWLFFCAGRGCYPDGHSVEVDDRRYQRCVNCRMYVDVTLGE